MDNFDELKKLILSLLISSPLQMTVHKLNKDFAEQVGFYIPFGKFGFRSLDGCLGAMTDILEVRGSGMSAEIVVHVSSKSAHIDKLVANQKTKPPRYMHFGNRPKARPRRSREHPILHNNRPETSRLNVQYNKPKCFPEQRSLPNTHYVPPHRAHSKPLEKQMMTSRSSPESALTPCNNSTLQPLMSKIIYSSQSQATASADNNLTNSPPNSKQQILNYDSLDWSSTLDREESDRKYEPVVSKNNEIQFSNIEHNNFDTSMFNNIDNYKCLGAIPKEAVCSSVVMPPVIQKDSEVYSSDEEEPINFRVPLKVQQHLQTLIDKYDDGIWCAKIPQAYHKMFNKELDYEEYGYKSLIQLCMDLKSIFFWYRPDNGDFKLYDRTKPPPKDLDKHFKQSDFIKTYSYINMQPSTEPAVADVEELLSQISVDHYPSDVVRLMDELPRQFITSSQEDDYIDVCVGEVYDASKFWLLLSEYSPFLDQLMDDMQAFYMSRPELKIPANMIRVGLYCAAVYNKEYHRAIIVNLMPQQQDKVKVFYVDYGTVSITLKANLHFLHTMFFELPQQAIRARLARIYPPTANTVWSTESSSRFLEMIKMKNLVAHIYHIDWDQQIVEVFLVDTSGVDDIYMNDALVKEGYAIFTHEEQRQIKLDPNFIPKTKHLHLIPSFDDMELGMVPNASEMIRLQKVGIAIELILPQYFCKANTVDTNYDIEASDRTIPKPEKKSTVAIRRSQLISRTESQSINDFDLSDQHSTASSKSHSDIVELDKLHSPSSETVVVKPPIRPPPGFESIQRQKIEITATTQNHNTGNIVNTVVKQTTNIEATSDTQNILNHLFKNGNGLHSEQSVNGVPTNVIMHPPTQYTAQNFVNQLMLLENQQTINNARQQDQIFRNFAQVNQNTYTQQKMLNPVYPNQNLFIPVSNSQCSYPNMQHPNIQQPNMQHLNMQHPNMQHPNMQTTHTLYYNDALSPLRLHIHETIIDLLLCENSVMVNRFLYIIKKRLSIPGVHHVFFSLISEAIITPAAYPRDKLNYLYKEALCFLNDEDIADLANEAKSYALFMESKSAGQDKQHSMATTMDELKAQYQKLNINETSNPEFKTNVKNVTTPISNTNKYHNIMQTSIGIIEKNQENHTLVTKIDFQNTGIHIIWLEHEAYAMVTEILQIVDKKIPIELVRKLIVMTDPSISVIDIQLQEHTNLKMELSRYIYLDATEVLHVVPITFVPKLITIVGQRKDLASNFDEIIRKVLVNSNVSLS